MYLYRVIMLPNSKYVVYSNRVKCKGRWLNSLYVCQVVVSSLTIYRHHYGFEDLSRLWYDINATRWWRYKDSKCVQLSEKNETRNKLNTVFTFNQATWHVCKNIHPFLFTILKYTYYLYKTLPTYTNA